MDILYQIRTRLDDLSAGESRIARLILADVAFAAAASLDALADRAEVSGATLSRFARRIGCKDLRDLRLQLAHASGVGARFLASDQALPQHPSRADARAEPAPHSAFYGQIVGDIEATLRQQLANFAEADFATAVALLDRAQMLHAFGMGGCSSMCAGELQVRLVRLGYAIAACHDPVVMRLIAATLGPSHTLVLFSLTGRPPELLEVAELARTYDTPVVAITAAGSPLAALADVTLPLHHGETDFIFKPTAARYGMLLTLDVLATELALTDQPANRERLRRIKLALDEYRGGEERLPLGD